MIPKEEIDINLRSMRSRMVKILAISLIAMGLISFFLIWKFGNSGFGGSYLLGALLGILNGVVGFLTIEKFIDRSSLVFMKGVFLGMGIRLFLLLGIFVILIKAFGAHIVALVTGLLIFYFAMTIFEVIFLNKRIELKKAIRGLAS